MAFTDALDLRTAVIEIVKRPAITDIFDRLVSLAEVFLNQNMRTSHQITETTVTFTSGRATLPSDLQAIIGLYGPNGAEYTQQSVQRQNQSGWRYGYSIEGNDIVSQSADGDVTLQYWAKIPTLVGDLTASNWLLANYPDVYLYAVAHEAAKAVPVAELVGPTINARTAAITSAQGAEDSLRFARARVRVGGCTP